MAPDLRQLLERMSLRSAIAGTAPMPAGPTQESAGSGPEPAPAAPPPDNPAPPASSLDLQPASLPPAPQAADEAPPAASLARVLALLQPEASDQAEDAVPEDQAEPQPGGPEDVPERFAEPAEALVLGALATPVVEMTPAPDLEAPDGELRSIVLADEGAEAGVQAIEEAPADQAAADEDVAPEPSDEAAVPAAEAEPAEEPARDNPDPASNQAALDELPAASAEDAGILLLESEPQDIAEQPPDEPSEAAELDSGTLLGAAPPSQPAEQKTPAWLEAEISAMADAAEPDDLASALENFDDTLPDAQPVLSAADPSWLPVSANVKVEALEGAHEGAKFLGKSTVAGANGMVCSMKSFAVSPGTRVSLSLIAPRFADQLEIDEAVVQDVRTVADRPVEAEVSFAFLETHDELPRFVERHFGAKSGFSLFGRFRR